MNRFFDNIKECILRNETGRLVELIGRTPMLGIDEKEIVDFLRTFGEHNKKNAEGAININGSGGTGFYKPNISSIAAMYISQGVSTPVIKTGSGAYSGIYGSSDFFRDLGLLDDSKRSQMLNHYGFAYYDYLEMSPWKRYKKILFEQKDFKNVFEKTVFFDYKASTYFLGISNARYHWSLNNNVNLDNEPDELFTYYSKVENSVIDEVYPGGTLYVNGEDFQVDNYGFGKVPIIKSIQDITKINTLLLMGEEIGFWKESLANTCALAFFSLKIVNSFEEGKELFEQLYKDCVVKKMLS